MFRRVWGSAAIFLLLCVQPGAHEASAAGASHAPGKKCDKPRKSGGLLGSLASSALGSALGNAGVPSSVGGIYLPVGSLLTSGIISLLNCKEQRQAANATQEAVRGGVGTTSTWQSENRPEVSGSSTVTQQVARADGSTCLTVSDVIIVNGEETTAPKTMCRAPGASSYVLAA